MGRALLSKLFWKSAIKGQFVNIYFLKYKCYFCLFPYFQKLLTQYDLYSNEKRFITDDFRQYDAKISKYGLEIGSKHFLPTYPVHPTTKALIDLFILLLSVFVGLFFSRPKCSLSKSLRFSPFCKFLLWNNDCKPSVNCPNSWSSICRKPISPRTIATKSMKILSRIFSSFACWWTQIFVSSSYSVYAKAKEKRCLPTR